MIVVFTEGPNVAVTVCTIVSAIAKLANVLGVAFCNTIQYVGTNLGQHMAGKHCKAD